jgi:hypothetical protein
MAFELLRLSPKQDRLFEEAFRVVIDAVDRADVTRSRVPNLVAAVLSLRKYEPIRDFRRELISYVISQRW